MTGVELEKYLMISDIFKDENIYMVEIIDGKIFNRVPSYYKAFIPYIGVLEIRIYYPKNSGGIKWIDFNIGNFNLYTCQLKNLDLTTLCNELSKILGRDQRFIDWSTKELRDFKINLLYEK